MARKKMRTLNGVTINIQLNGATINVPLNIMSKSNESQTDSKQI
jgi:hypothetical protein